MCLRHLCHVQKAVFRNTPPHPLVLNTFLLPCLQYSLGFEREAVDVIERLSLAFSTLATYQSLPQLSPIAKESSLAETEVALTSG